MHRDAAEPAPSRRTVRLPSGSRPPSHRVAPGVRTLRPGSSNPAQHQRERSSPPSYPATVRPAWEPPRAQQSAPAAGLPTWCSSVSAHRAAPSDRPASALLRERRERPVAPQLEWGSVQPVRSGSGLLRARWASRAAVRSAAHSPAVRAPVPTGRPASARMRAPVLPVQRPSVQCRAPTAGRPDTPRCWGRMCSRSSSCLTEVSASDPSGRRSPRSKRPARYRSWGASAGRRPA